MLIPFHQELDDVFRSDRSIWLKIGGCTLVGAMAGLLGTTRFQPEKQPIAVIAIGASATAIIGAIIGLCLSLKDVVKRRTANGQPVNLLLRVYFGWGAVSILLWFVTIFVSAIGIILLSMMQRGLKI